jgi:ferredoxin
MNPSRPSAAAPAALTISAGSLSAAELRALCLAAGADDVGFVRIDHPLVASERPFVDAAFPGGRTLISLVVRMQRANVQSLSRSVANQAFHALGHEVDDVCRRIVLALEDRGVRACNPSMGFPMELSAGVDERPWVVAHKPVAEAAGLGRMGIHRSVIHPRFGSFILLGTVLIDRDVDVPTEPIDFNPCVSCKLCVAACPVGALGADGHFDGAACLTHNYREFLGGFTDWVETVVSSSGVADYRSKVEDGENLSLWQSLSFGANYKAAYCLAVCPAGEDVIGRFTEDRAAHLRTVVRPLQDRVEPLYVVPGSDAEAYAAKRFPHKRLRRISNGMRPGTIGGFLRALPWMFQRNASTGLDAVYHFAFTGREPVQATVTIRDRTIDVQPGHHGVPQVTVTADSEAWIRFVRRERPLWQLLVRGHLRLRPWRDGARLLSAFGRCFP